jgi:hypothetical protein
LAAAFFWCSLFVLAQFLTEGYGEVAELNRVTLFLELL